MKRKEERLERRQDEHGAARRQRIDPRAQARMPRMLRQVRARGEKRREEKERATIEPLDWVHWNSLCLRSTEIDPATPRQLSPTLSGPAVLSRVPCFLSFDPSFHRFLHFHRQPPNHHHGHRYRPCASALTVRTPVVPRRRSWRLRAARWSPGILGPRWDFAIMEGINSELLVVG